MLLVIKTTKSCNLRCKYCYMQLSDSIDSKQISLDIVKTIIKKFGEYYNKLTFSWHGGEPLLLEKDFYSKVCDLQNEFLSDYPEKTFTNSIQTNGTLLTDIWYKHLKSLGFGIGFSYDGNDFNNSNRLTKNGNEINQTMLELFSKLKNKYNHPPNSICVLTKTNINSAFDIYNHFKEIGFDSFSILPYLGQDKELRIDSQEFFDFHKTIFDLWINKNEKQIKRITPFTQILSSIVGSNETICSWDGRCFQDIHCIDPAGDVFLCSGFFKDEHKIGNILKDSINEIYNSSNFKKALKYQDNVLRMCKNCDVSDVCNSGCREASYYTYGKINMKDPLCEGRKELIHYIMTKFYSEIENTLFGKENSNEKLSRDKK